MSMCVHLFLYHSNAVAAEVTTADILQLVLLLSYDCIVQHIFK